MRRPKSKQSRQLLTRFLQIEWLENRWALAANPFLLQDIRTGNVRTSSHPESFTRSGDKIFFTAYTPQTGIELWTTDGTAAGTKLVKDINPFKDRSSNPKYLTDVNGTLFFAATDGASGTELWKSDGTEAGTVRVKNIAIGRYASSSPNDLVNVNGTLYFSTLSIQYGPRTLWRSDGTEEGTIEVKQANGASLSSVRGTINFNGVLYFKTGFSGTYSLWNTDSAGTTATRIPGVTVSSAEMQVFGDQLIFGGANGTSGMELWRSDGTVAGTKPLAQIAPGSTGSYPFLFTPVGNQLFFVASRPGENQQLWKTDGTTEGTVQLRAVNTSGDAGAAPRELTNVNGRLYCVGESEQGKDLWTSDGTTAGTRLVNDFQTSYFIGPQNLVNANGQLFFASFDRTIGFELWTSGGTAATTQVFKEFRAGTESGLTGISVIDGMMYLSADDGRGAELWKSDGTPTGTVLVRDLARAARNSLYDGGPSGVNLNGTLYFFSNNYSEYMTQTELWKTDGTTLGTEVVKALPRGFNSTADLHRTLTNLNGTLYFVANNENVRPALWKTDGTSAGTVPVVELTKRPASMINVGGKLFFDGFGDRSDTELWQSDGTAAGTKLLKDIATGFRSSFPKSFFNFNGNLYFTAETTAGRELWRSNGTEAGTIQVRDIATGLSSAFDRYRDPEFVNVNGTLYFTASDPTGGIELWKSRGTSATTSRVRDIRPGVRGSAPTSLTNVNGVLYFAANDGTTGYELWKSRGTAASTVLVRELTPGSNRYRPSYLTNVDGILYFTGLEYAGGIELWRSDGTAQGTRRIIDILPGKESSQPHSLTNVQGKLYFVATSASAGTELWSSDGTPANTKIVADLTQPGSSSPFHLTVLGSTLLFAATTQAFGTEWWGLETRVPEGVTIVDDSSASFARTGTWSRLSEGRNGQSFVAAPGTGAALATWSFDGLTAGTYRVFATWTADPDRSTNVRYRLRESLADPTNLLVKSVNQRQTPTGLTDQGSIWSELGTVIITGQSLVVQLSNNTTTGRVVADAIRIERIIP